jgi:hypothetical protein
MANYTLLDDPNEEPKPKDDADLNFQVRPECLTPNLDESAN